MIRLIATDLDDTLLNSNLEIPAENIAAIRRAEARGTKVVLASGRAPAAMKRFAETLLLHQRDGYLIADNGATVLSTRDWQIIRRFTLSADIAVRAWKLAQREGLPMQYYEDGAIRSSPDINEYSELDTRLTGIPMSIAQDFASDLKIPRKKLVIPGDPEKLKHMAALLTREFGDAANVFISKPFFLEILNPQADKGHALEWIAGETGLDSRDVVAIGDSMNDLGMLTFAGHPVAIANAREEIKQAAEYITTRNHDQAGVAEAIERYLPDE